MGNKSISSSVRSFVYTTMILLSLFYILPLFPNHSLSFLFLHVKCIPASFFNHSNSTSFLCGTLSHFQLHLSDLAHLGRHTGVVVLAFT